MFDSSMNSLLTQESLVKDYLGRFRNIAKEANTPLKKSAFIWGIEQFVALDTMKNDDWLVRTYEDLCTNPIDEFQKILKYLRVKTDKSRLATIGITEPSDTVRSDSAILTSRNPSETWKQEMERDDVEAILQVVRGFSLDKIYDESLHPHSDVLDRVLRHEIKLQ